MKKNVVWGVAILIIAFVYLLQALDIIHSISIITVVLLSFFCGGVVQGIYKKSVAKIVYSLTFLYYFGAGYFGLPELGLFTLLVFATLIIIGFALILGKKAKIFVIEIDKTKAHNVNYDDILDDFDCDNDVSISTTFGDCKRYISSEDFRKCDISCTFGNVAVYFDNAIIKGDSATVNISCNFGDVRLYVPENWKVDAHPSVMFGDLTTDAGDIGVYDKTLKVNGSVNFGDVRIKRR